jgi:hypothetical protein
MDWAAFELRFDRAEGGWRVRAGGPLTGDSPAEPCVVRALE